MIHKLEGTEKVPFLFIILVELISKI